MIIWHIEKDLEAKAFELQAYIAYSGTSSKLYSIILGVGHTDLILCIGEFSVTWGHTTSDIWAWNLCYLQTIPCLPMDGQILTDGRQTDWLTGELTDTGQDWMKYKLSRAESYKLS